MIEKEYVITDEWNKKLAEAELVAVGGPEEGIYSVRDRKAIKNLSEGQIVRIRKNRVYAEVFEGEIKKIEKHEVTIAGLENISQELRADFKYKCSFRTVIVPIEVNLADFKFDGDEEDGEDSGQEEEQNEDDMDPIEILTKDLSSSGIGFYTERQCPMWPIYELIVPITKEPMVVRMKLVRCDFDPEENRYMCGGRFVGLQAGEESLLRKTIMRMQVLDRRRMRDKIDRDGSEEETPEAPQPEEAPQAK